ncbi:peptide chain release factor N(5)-glutamine methyltransferase [Blastopirellula marina]|uniref:Release factor glutamine methyltransferase n=1 Tax=Blastopirellula marina TaxID=124 RepID=A0A2S8FCT7_9BACT|nr:peptide chain release factor N(5)-glutamine methyltransferase [Blastopirellula marina]PQO29942.1 peptide chain release factor N(5)-glutamine methyltransferase [Blastopirellula marina]PTL42410.1 peptide chain release factor N(5)-glutamine methyltransferase [Blastopirellula marina]
MSTAEPWTIGRLLNWTTEYLESKGSDEARLEAQLLLCHALGCQKIQLYTRFEETVDDEKRSTFRELVKQRAAGIPVAYLLGTREFYSMEFAITPDVLIPRPETEHLVIETLDRLKARAGEEGLRLLELGTGSGIIAVTVAKHAKNVTCLATDISEKALQVAKGNAEKHGVSERIEFAAGDLFAAVPAGETFDVIVSNPPYVADAERSLMDPQVIAHEPHVALFAEEEGTAVLRRILEQAAGYLNPGGWLFLEFSPMIAGRVAKIAEQLGTYQQISIGKDLAKHDRYLIAQKAG